MKNKIQTLTDQMEGFLKSLARHLILVDTQLECLELEETENAEKYGDDSPEFEETNDARISKVDEKNAVITAYNSLSQSINDLKNIK